MSKLTQFLRRHKHGEEIAAEAIGISVAWRLLAMLLVAGSASAAVEITQLSTKHRSVRLAEVPRRYAAPTATQQRLVRYGLRVGPQSHTVYVWGGTSPRGFDCSGFTQYVYARVTGTIIPRTSESQWASGSGTFVPKQNERAGDLVYFVGAFGNRHSPGHVGLYIGNGRYVEYYHSGARAKVSTLSEFSYGYLGAKRWYTPARVPARRLAYLVRIAARFHERIIGSFTEKGWVRWAVTFVPRSRRLHRWAKAQHLITRQSGRSTLVLLRP